MGLRIFAFQLYFIIVLSVVVLTAFSAEIQILLSDIEATTEDVGDLTTSRRDNKHCLACKCCPSVFPKFTDEEVVHSIFLLGFLILLGIVVFVGCGVCILILSLRNQRANFTESPDAVTDPNLVGRIAKPPPNFEEALKYSKKLEYQIDVDDSLPPPSYTTLHF